MAQPFLNARNQHDSGCPILAFFAKVGISNFFSGGFDFTNCLGLWFPPFAKNAKNGTPHLIL